MTIADVIVLITSNIKIIKLFIKKDFIFFSVYLKYIKPPTHFLILYNFN